MGLFDELKKKATEIVNDTVGDTLNQINALSKPIAKPQPSKPNQVPKHATPSHVQAKGHTVAHAQTTSLPTKDDGLHYSDKIEKLINVAMVDGQISETELRVLRKRAESEGVDPDELEMVLDARLHAKNTVQKENSNPVRLLTKGFTLVDEYAKAPTTAFDKEELEKTITNIPGISAAMASITTLLSSFLSKPANKNQLKAKVIQFVRIPDDPELMAEFLQFASSLIVAERSKDKSTGFFGTLSNAVFGSDIDLKPILYSRINEVSLRGMSKFPENMMLQKVIMSVHKSPVQLLQEKIYNPSDLPIPADNRELMELIQYLSHNIKEPSSDLESFISTSSSGDILQLYYRVYQEAGLRFANNPQLMAELKKNRITEVDKVEAGIISLSKTSIPEDNEELIELLEYAYGVMKRNKYDEVAKDLVKKLYPIAMSRVSNDPELKHRASKCRIKLFGVF